MSESVYICDIRNYYYYTTYIHTIYKCEITLVSVCQQIFYNVYFYNLHVQRAYFVYYKFTFNLKYVFYDWVYFLSISYVVCCINSRTLYVYTHIIYKMYIYRTIQVISYNNECIYATIPSDKTHHHRKISYSQFFLFFFFSFNFKLNLKEKLYLFNRGVFK